jgi:hypothetical protein
MRFGIRKSRDISHCYSQNIVVIKYSNNIQKLEREKRFKKREELRKIVSPVHKKRKNLMINPKGLSSLRSSGPKSKSSEDMSSKTIEVPKPTAKSTKFRPSGEPSVIPEHVE